MTRNQTTIALGAAGFIGCVGVFLVALTQQFGAVAALACLAAWLQLAIVISTVGDALSDRQAASSLRSIFALLLILFIAASYVVANHGV
jgi:hypothetical protein